MTPFSVQNLIQELNFRNKDFDLISSQFKFCNSFEDEMNLPNGSYSENIYAMIYNLFEFKKSFSSHKFSQILDLITSLNYTNHQQVKELTDSLYKEIITNNLDYFVKTIKMRPEAVNENNLMEYRERVLNEFF